MFISEIILFIYVLVCQNRLSLGSNDKQRTKDFRKELVSLI